MHFLVYQKMRDTLRDDPDMIYHSFKNRAELLKWALDNGIHLYPQERVLILNGETGEQERGTNDIRSEIARVEAEELAEVPNG
jgi:hypothetical protein